MRFDKRIMIKGKLQVFALFVLFLVGLPVLAATQHAYHKTMVVGSAAYEMGHAVAYDNAGNLFYAGHVGNGADVDPTAGTDIRTTSAGSVDMLLTKMNVDGSYAWSRVLGAANFDRGSSLVTDNSGNVYLAGQFSGSIDFNAGSVADVHVSANNGLEYDIFLTKINADGSYAWTRVLGGYMYIYGRSIDVDSQGNVYVAAAFSIPQDFALEGAGDQRSPAGGNDIALMKINADGSYGWTHTLGSAGFDMGHSVTVDNNDNVYFTGHFTGTVDLDPTGNSAKITSDMNSSDVFVMKFDSNDTYQWTKTFGGPEWDGPYNIDSDDAGNVYVSGLFTGTSDLDPTTDIALSTSTGPVDIYITKLNADGTFAWAQTLGEPAPFYYKVVNWGGAMSVDGAGNVYVSRCFVDSMDFDPTTAVDLRVSSGLEDIFVTQLNTDGSYGWTHTMGGASTDCANAVVASTQGDLAVTGNFEGTADFNAAGGGDFATSLGGKDIFVTTFKEPAASTENISIDVTRVKVEDDDEISVRVKYVFNGTLDSTDLIRGSVNGAEIASAYFSDFYEKDPGEFVFKANGQKIEIDTNTGKMKFKRKNTDLAQYNIGAGVSVTVEMSEATGTAEFTGMVIYDD